MIISGQNRIACTLAKLKMFLSVIVLAGFTAQAQAEDSSEAVKDYAPGGTQTCLMCHNNDHVKSIMQTPHYNENDSRTPGAQLGCQSCHGPSADHMKNPMANKPIQFGTDSKDDVFTQNETCLTCHEKEKQVLWHAGVHAANDVSCASCHTAHTPKDPILDPVLEAQTCYSCHTEKRADEMKRSHHPIREGLVTCSDCHNPHGSGAERAELVEPTVNETCAQCHADKRGPFLFEHPPVAEDCTTCHNPHGSVQPNMLEQRAPFLCSQCHTGAHNENRITGHSCMDCHSKIHGTNDPHNQRL